MLLAVSQIATCNKFSWRAAVQCRKQPAATENTKKRNRRKIAGRIKIFPTAIIYSTNNLNKL